VCHIGFIYMDFSGRDCFQPRHHPQQCCFAATRWANQHNELAIVDFQGNTVTGIVGRVKIEKRPLMLVRAIIKEKEVAVILQNAETVRLTSWEGDPISVVNLNPGDNDLVAAMIGNFQDGTVPGKIQFGSGWWFNDQKDGMIRQMTSLANMSLLSRFVGMLTDSRSFLSYPRHEYFRRILSELIGSWVENGEAPKDMKLLGSMVQDICYTNAVRYFQVPGVKID